MYEIIINRIESVTRKARGEWCVVGEAIYSQKEIDESGRRFNEKDPVTKSVWGYPPEREITEEKSRQVFRQQVDALDLQAVIRAINEKGAGR